MKKALSVLMAALLLVSVFAVTVFADDDEGNPSPGKETRYTVTVIVDGDKGGTAYPDPGTVIEGETTTITAKPDDGYEFGGWTFEGEFEWVEGDANSPVIVIRPKGNVTFTAKFVGAGGPGRDQTPVSPTTNEISVNYTVIVMAALLSISAAAAVVAGKKYFSAR